MPVKLVTTSPRGTILRTMWNRNKSVRLAGMLSAVLLTLVLAHRACAAEPPEGVVFEKDVLYGKAGDVELKLDISRPKKPASARLPCIVVIHGGGWKGGDKVQHQNMTWDFASRDYVSATIGYRLAPKHRFPAQVHDVKCAVRYLRANAGKYGLDPQRIGAIGFSAGAHLSMMLGTTTASDGLEGENGWPDQPSQVQAVVAFFGPTDLAADDIPVVVLDILKDFIGGTKAEKPAEFRKASPLTYVSLGDAPMLLFQGTKDPLVPHTQVYPMVEAMTKFSIPGRAELLLNAGHGWGPPELSRTAAASMAFFEEHLRAKASPPQAASPAPAGAAPAVAPAARGG
jgi:acetyl esterase/lipase